MTGHIMLRRDDIGTFITRIYAGDLHAKRVLSLANATPGVLTRASLAVHAIGQGLAQAMGKLGKHGVKQVDRLPSNDGIEMGRFFCSWVKYIVGARPEVAAALDWTSFARDGHETVVLSMLTGHGRAAPLMRRGPATSNWPPPRETCGDTKIMFWQMAFRSAESVSDLPHNSVCCSRGGR